MCAGIDQSLYMLLQPCGRSQEKRGVAGSVTEMNRGALRQKVAKDFDIIACRCEVLSRLGQQGSIKRHAGTMLLQIRNVNG